MLRRPLTAYCVATLVVATLTAEGAFADSFQNASTASGDSAEASTRLAASGAQLTLGAVAIPLQAADELSTAVGEASSWVGEDLWETANEPLTVSNEVLTAVPPPALTPPTSPREE